MNKVLISKCVNCFTVHLNLIERQQYFPYIHNIYMLQKNNFHDSQNNELTKHSFKWERM